MRREENDSSVADEAFLDALLERVHDADESKRVRRLESALDRTRPAPEIKTKPSFVAAWGRFGAIAAAVLVVVGLVFFGDDRPRSSARAALQRSIEVMSVATDRQYALEFVQTKENKRPVRGELFVRGEGRFLIRLERYLGDFFVAEDEASSWVLRPGRDVPLVVRPPGYMRARLGTAEFDQNLPVLDIRAFLRQARDHYRLEIAEEGRDRVVVKARLRDEETEDDLPSRIDIETDAEGLVLRVRRTWDRPNRRSLREITLTLSGSEPLPDDTYAFGRYRGDRRVVDLR